MAVKSQEPMTLGEALLAEKLIDKKQFDQALAETQSTNKSFASAIVNTGAVSEGMTLGILQKKLNIPVVSLANKKLSPMAADRIPRDICEKYHLVAYDMEGNDLLVAMEDPTDKEVIKVLKLTADMSIKPQAAKSAEIAELIKQIPQKSAVKSPTQKKRGKLLGTLFIIIMTFLPIFVVLALLIWNDGFNKAFRELQLEPFERVLVFIMSMALWASFIYFIHDLIFPSDNSDEDEPEYIP